MLLINHKNRLLQIILGVIKTMDGRIYYLKNYILENLQNNLKIDELAKRVNVSAPYLQQIFKSNMGITPQHFVKEVRLERAKVLLETSFLRIKEIRLAIGIQDESHFTKDFKDKYDLTPSEYRNKFWKTLEIEE